MALGVSRKLETVFLLFNAFHVQTTSVYESIIAMTRQKLVTSFSLSLFPKQHTSTTLV